ncbi:TIGR00730 family Rossman fold protein [uncultured Paenalcaligenes sp.]|uniref:LOG family protein n=1 Tax=uncultured Paenalcaligenes sp. TaxID=1588925 RepID=UPI002630B564|nr:TIGR00730 family Rossman fold protein [uncultured Paenalcaligenes sp.]
MSNNKVVRLPASMQIPTISKELQTAVDTLQEIGWGVSVFGSARIKPDHKYYQLAEELGQRLAKANYPVIAGGGPGIMEAANKGAFEAGGKSVGLNIRLPRETTNNPYQTHSLQFEYFYSRKATFFMHSAAYIALPGGFGTLDELFEAITLVQTKKNPPAPIVLVGSDFWAGLIEWVKEQLISHAFIGANDVNLVTVTDDLDEVMRIVNSCCAQIAADQGKAPVLPQETPYTKD